MLDIVISFSKDWRVLLALLFISVVLYLISTRPRCDYWSKRGFPEIPMRTLPVFGHTFKMLIGMKSFSDTLNEFYAASGENPFAGFYEGKHPCLLVKNPDLIRSILVADFPIFVDRAFQGVGEGADPLEARALSHLHGRQWKEMRARLNPTFSADRMKAMFSLTKDCTAEMLEVLRKETDEGEHLVDVKELMACYLTDVLASCVFGVRSDALKNPRTSQFGKIGKRLIRWNWRRKAVNTLQNVAPGLLSKLPLRSKPDDTPDFLRNLVRDSVEKREQALKDEVQKGALKEMGRRTAGDFIDMLVALKESEDSLTSFHLNNDDLTAQAILFFSSGLKATLSLLSSALFELSSSKEGIEIQQQLREEIDSTMGSDGGRITYESLKKMELLDRVLSETLRLHPPVGVLSRKCNSQYRIPDTNLFLYKGSRIFIPVQSLQNDPKYFPDPGRFDPDRFLPENAAQRPDYVYLPFGGGPRMCIGLRFAFMQAQLGLSSLLSKFVFEIHHKKSEVPVELSRHSLHRTRSIWLRVRKRRKDFRRNACTHQDLEQHLKKLQI